MKTGKGDIHIVFLFSPIAFYVHFMIFYMCLNVIFANFYEFVFLKCLIMLRTCSCSYLVSVLPTFLFFDGLQ